MYFCYLAEDYMPGAHQMEMDTNEQPYQAIPTIQVFFF